MSPVWVLNVPSSSVPATVPKVVLTVPVKMPVFGPVSVKVRLSLSPVTVFTELTITVSAPPVVSRSASVTVMVSVSPGTLGSVIATSDPD